MADKRITDLNLHTSPQLSDVIPIVNSGETKKIAYGTLYNEVRDGLVSGSSQIVLGDVTNFTSYSSSVESQLTNLINATSSYLTSETDSQTLSIVGDQLSISNGNTVTIPTGSAGTSIDTGSFYVSSTASGPQITFTQGDGTTEFVVVDNVTSASYATNAETATNSDNVGVVIDNTTGTKYVPFVDVSSGYDNLKVDTGLVYSAFSNTLTVGGAVTAPAFNGLATNATNVNIGTTSLNTNYYVSFAYGAGNNRVNIDGGGQFIYNPSTNTLTVPTVVGNLTGTATNATTASHALDAMVTGSLNDGTLTFTKGDSSTFDINLESVFTKHAWISTYSTSSQALVSSGSAQPVTFTSIWTQNGVSLVSGSQITFAEAGTYEFNFVAQVENSSNTTYDAYFWVKYNGSNFPNSSTQMTMRPRKSSGEPNAQLMNVSIIGVAQNNNDYIELYWTGESTELSLAETPAFNGVPETPSVIASIKRIG